MFEEDEERAAIQGEPATEKAAPRVVVLVDLGAVFWPAWHAGASKPPAFAMEVTISRVRKLAGQYGAVAVCVDSVRNFRRDLDPGYKANREEKDAGAAALLAETEKELDAAGFHILGAEGFEADDVIATACAQLAPRVRSGEIQIRIHTGDKDLLALLGPGIDVLSTRSGEVVTHDAVIANPKIAVPPRMVRDFLLLAGDNADGASYFKGIGPERARNLLAQFDRGDAEDRSSRARLDRVFAALDEKDPADPKGQRWLIHPPSVRAALLQASKQQINGRPLLDVAIEIFTMRTDAPIDASAIFAPKAKRERDPTWDESEQTTRDQAVQPEHVGASAPTPSRAEAPRVELVESAQPRAQSSALVVPQRWDLALEPTDSGGARALAKWAHASNFWHQHGTPEALFMIILAGRAHGVCAFDALNGYHVIEGRPVMGAHLLIGMVKASPLCLYLDVIESDEAHAVAVTRRKGSKHEQRRTYTIDQADRVGLLKPTRTGRPSNWIKHPEDMLIKSVQVKLARQVYSDVIGATLTAEEMGEHD